MTWPSLKGPFGAPVDIVKLDSDHLGRTQAEARHEQEHGIIALPVLRGESLRPLFVSAAGMDHARAAALVQGMHGAYRVPTLLKRADQLARGRSSPSQLPEPSKGGAP